jgi:hypothetical protein
MKPGCAHPAAKVIAEWVEPELVAGAAWQWFHCEVCGDHWRELREQPLPQGTRLTDVAAVVPGDESRPHLGWWLVTGVVVFQLLLFAAMIAFTIWMAPRR